MGFTREELVSFRDALVPDLIGQDLRLLFVGINPGLWTAATQTHFAHPGNRFYPALHLAGITAAPIDPSAGATDEDRRRLTSRGIGISNVVARATARADELSREEFVEGASSLVRRIERWQPQVVCFVGITAYRTAFARPKARKGEQPDQDRIAGAAVWALGNPSGLNAHETALSLAQDYREVAEAAGVPLDPPRW